MLTDSQILHLLARCETATGQFLTQIRGNQHNPAALPSFGEPVLVLGIRGKVVVVDVQCGAGLTERSGDAFLPQRTIEEEDGRVRPLRWRVRT